MSKGSSSGGIGFCGLLTVAFVVMKLAEVGAVSRWSWLWVLSPLWIPLAIMASIVVSVVIFGLISGTIDRRRVRNKWRIR